MHQNGDTAVEPLEALNFYQVLQSERSATTRELKRNYQRLLRAYHPDKRGVENKCHDLAFLKLQKAWEVLKDPELRKMYDNELCYKEDSELLLHETIDLSEMVLSSHGASYEYPCRCGSFYFLEQSEAAFVDAVVLTCDICSFSIQVNQCKSDLYNNNMSVKN